MMVKVASVLSALSAVHGARIQRKSTAGAASGCGAKGASGPSSSIVNGQPATECEWRWQAQLWRLPRGPFCGGTLISPEWVLTAAHCVEKPDFDVVLGDYNTSGTPSKREQKIRASEVYQHPGYAKNPTRNDYAMVRLESPAVLNECVGTACLPSAGADVAAATQCWITGWGTLGSGELSPEILQEAPVNIISNEDCVSKFNYAERQIDDSMICAQGRTDDGLIVDACQGDSGGPLVCESGGQWTVYGATSWGRGCAGANYPGVWARVHNELAWIENILEGNVPTPAPTPVPTPRPATPAPAPRPPGTCPQETSTGPDNWGDCRCNKGLVCEENGERGCTFGMGQSQRYFFPDCETCRCTWAD